MKNSYTATQNSLIRDAKRDIDSMRKPSRQFAQKPIRMRALSASTGPVKLRTSLKPRKFTR